MKSRFLGYSFSLVFSLIASHAAAPSFLAAAPTIAPGEGPVRIVIIGDSTICDYPANRPERGWGQFIEKRF